MRTAGPLCGRAGEVTKDGRSADLLKAWQHAIRDLGGVAASRLPARPERRAIWC